MDQQNSSQNIYAKILSQHGRDVLNAFRKAKNTGSKISSWRNHRMFNLRCKHCDVTPPSVKLSSNIPGSTAKDILHKAEKKLIEVRIRQCNFTLQKLKIEEENALSQLYTQLKEPDTLQLREVLMKSKQTQFEEVKTRQRSKFDTLIAKKKCTDNVIAKDFSKIQERWVHNKSSKELDKVTTTLLSKGLNFAVTPRHFPTEEIITSTELACKSLDEVTAASLRSEVARSVKRRKDPKPNISPEEIKALHELKKDNDIMILPADKGRATIVLDKSDYESKMQNLLSDTKTYEVLKKDPTPSVKNKILTTLKTWKKEGTISQSFYRQVYPTSDLPPKFYGLPKIHKKDMPFRPIVSGNGSVTEGVAKHLAKVLNSVKGKNKHAIKNSDDFVQRVSDLEVPPGLKMVSFDVSALFTSIPIDYALRAIKSKLLNDDSWKNITELNLDQVLNLLELCLSTTYFIFRGTFYRQKFGAPMGSPISPGVADLCMEVFEEETLATCPPHLAPKVWVRFVDDTFSTLHEYSIEDFTTYLNSRNPHIQFTREVEEDGRLPFLDVSVQFFDDGSVKTTVYRKPMHTERVLTVGI